MNTVAGLRVIMDLTDAVKTLDCSLLLNGVQLDSGLNLHNFTCTVTSAMVLIVMRRSADSKFLLLLLTLAGLLTAQVSSQAQTSVATTPVGYVQLACTGSSDTVVSVPFAHCAARNLFVRQAGFGCEWQRASLLVARQIGLSNQYIYSGSRIFDILCSLRCFYVGDIC